MSSLDLRDHGDVCPRLFSVLGSGLTRASLQQAQQDVDTVVEVSHATSSGAATRASSSSPSTAHASHSLRRVLDTLYSVAAAAQSADANSADTTAGDASSEPPVNATQPASSFNSDGAVRETLMQALGVATGSALFRECVVAPRRRLHTVVHQLAQAVRTRYLPLLARHGNVSASESVDIHVQLYPSQAQAAHAALPPLLSKAAGGFCAAVTVRRLSALEAEAQAEQRLKARYTNVAAPGQTLAGTLLFWSDVSYGDVAPAGLEAYPPLGFEEEASASRAAVLRAAGVTEEDRQLGRKAPRSLERGGVTEQLRHNVSGKDQDGADVTGAVVLLGLPEHVEREQLQVSFEEAVLMQPACLLTNLPQAGRGAAQHSANAPTRPPAVTYQPAGVLAVLYVHCSGVAYAGYPVAHQRLARPEVELTAETQPPVEDVPKPPPPLPMCGLPMLSSTGFVRSLLGLS